MRQALPRGDLFAVAVDLFPTDTTDFADFVLPAASFLEFGDLVASYFDLTLSAQVKATEPIGEALLNREIFRRLAQAMGFIEPELYEGDADVIATVFDQTGLGETFASLATKGTVPISLEPLIQFEDCSFPTLVAASRSPRPAPKPMGTRAYPSRLSIRGRLEAGCDSSLRLPRGL